MDNGYTKRIRERVLSLEDGTVFVMSDFADIADTSTIRQSLSRLVQSGTLRRILKGVYEKPKYSKLLDEYVGLNIVGVHHGYFSDNETDDIVKQINESGAKLLLVCLGAPKQEKWIFENKSKLTNVSLCMGVGGALDVFAGVAKRAPELFIKCNLEWLYRFCKNPSRLGRFATLPKFVMTVRKDKKKNK